VKTLLAAALLLAAPLRGQESTDEIVPAAQFRERVDVERVLLDLRIVDGKGAPIPGLRAEDVRVRVDGKPAEVESLRWVSGTTAYAEGLSPAEAAANGVAAAPPGRLIVFFFQKDLDPSRSSGLIRMKREAAKLLASLEPEDRVAVVSFDTHLRLWTDFTTDRARLRRIVEREFLVDDDPPSVLAASDFSLAAGYDYAAARDAATPEAAFVVIGRALAPVPGSKSIAFFGWGLGRTTGGVLSMVPEYESARQLLSDARIAVFALDVTDADYHTLEIGLRQIADDTGGFYAKTHDFPNLAMARLERALQGYYALSFFKPSPALPRGRHEVTIDVPGRRAEVLVNASYVD
jgi:VWFA-related protein